MKTLLTIALLTLFAITSAAVVTARINEVLINALADSIAVRGSTEQTNAEIAIGKIADAKTALGQNDIETAISLLDEAIPALNVMKRDGEQQQYDAQSIKNEILSPTGEE